MNASNFERDIFTSEAFLPHRDENNGAKEFNAKKPSSKSLSNGFGDVDYCIQTLSGQEKKRIDHFDRLTGAQLKDYIHIEVYPNGGGSMVHVYENEIASLSPDDKEKLALLFFEEVFREEPESVAKHVIGIVHNAAAYMPELVSHLALTIPDLDVKVRLAGNTACLL